MKIVARLDMKSNDEILKRLGVNQGGYVQKVIDSEVIRQCEPYVPMDEGVLTASAWSSTKLGKANDLLSQQEAYAGEVARELSEASNGAGIMQKAVSSVKKVLGGIASMVKKLAAAAMSAGKKILSSVLGGGNSGIVGGLKDMLKYGVGVRSLYALVSKLRSALVEGFKNLAQVNGTTNQSLSMLKSSIDALKNGAAAAFAPLLNAAAPVLTKIIDLATSAANAIAKLMAILTGRSTFSVATKQQKDFASSLSGTGKAAAEAKKQLMGFDELNIIGDSESSGGGGSAGGFMTESVDASEYGSLVDAFNNMIQSVDFDEIGRQLGQGLNKVTKFISDFITGVSWPDLGSKLSSGFNSLIATVEWDTLGKVLIAKFSVLIGLIGGFLENIDAASLATGLFFVRYCCCFRE